MIKKPYKSYFPVHLFLWSPCPTCFASELSLCLLALLKGKPEEFLATFALKCSSWSPVNRGTSGRAPCASTGIQEYPSVLEANTMGVRFPDSIFNNILIEYIYKYILER